MNNDVVIISLDRERQLKFTHGALKTLVELVGKDIGEIDEQFNPGNFDLVEKMAYCAMLRDAKENSEVLTLEKTIELLDEAPSFAHIVEKISNAWLASMGGRKQEEPQQEGNDQQPDTTNPAKGNTTGKKASE